METLLWLSIGLLVYSYLLYPFVLLVCSKLFNKSKTWCKNAQHLPDITVIISAFNEQSCIADRIKNLNHIDYPQHKIKLLVGSDGSTDDTNEILLALAKTTENLQVELFSQNRGKMSVLNDLIAKATTDIVVMSDANTEFAEDALIELTQPFVDENIGAVCGELVLYNAGCERNQDDKYWQYERF